MERIWTIALEEFYDGMVSVMEHYEQFEKADKWLTEKPYHEFHAEKAKSHLNKHGNGETLDHETKLNTLYHAGCREAMLVFKDNHPELFIKNFRQVENE